MADTELQDLLSWERCKEWLQSFSPHYVVGSGRKPGKSLAHRFIERQTGRQAATISYGEKAYGRKAELPAFITFELAGIAFVPRQYPSFVTLAEYLDPEGTVADAKRSWKVLAGEAVQMMYILETSPAALEWAKSPYYITSRLYESDREEYNQRKGEWDKMAAQVKDINRMIVERI